MAKGTPENWPGAFKAVGIRALSTGRFWQFCFAGLLGWWVYQIKSEDWVQIAAMFLENRFYSGLGWALFVLTVLVSIVSVRTQRSMYLKEIDRISQERSSLQKLAIPQTKQSKYKSK